MANIVLSSPSFFSAGASGASAVVGYESGRNRVARYSFTAPSTGATSVSLDFSSMWYGAGTQPKTLRFYIGTDANSHVNAGAGSTYTGVLNINTNGYTGYLGSANINLMPNGTYYLFVFPDSTTFGWYNWAGNAAMTTGGAYGASVITSAGAVTLGNACNVKWTPVSASFRYKLTFSLGGWSYTTGLIHPNTTSAYTYTGYVIPLEVASRITNSNKGAMTVQLTSYDSGGTTQVGAVDTEAFAVTVPENDATKPTVSMELSLVSNLQYPFDNLYIQNLTKVDADISASGKYGASVKTRQLVMGGGVYEDPFLTDYLTATGDVTLTAKATDSRGFSGKAEQTIHVIPYSKPSLIPADGETNIVCRRCDQDGNLTDSGTYLKVKAKRSYSPVVSDGEQYNFCLIRYRCNGGSWVTILAGDDSGDEVDITIPNVVISTTSAYTIEIGVVDDLGYEFSTLIIVPSDKVEFHLRDGGNGAAFGEYAEEEKVLAVAESWELKVKGKLTVGEPQGDQEAANKGYVDKKLTPSAAAIEESDQYPGCFYRMVNGEAEWCNPPFVIGTEYRTTQRWKGNAVYAKLLQFTGLFPSGAQTHYFANQFPGVTEVVSVKATGTNGSIVVSLPFVDQANNFSCWAYNNSGGQIAIASNYKTAYTTVYALVQYIK